MCIRPGLLGWVAAGALLSAAGLPAQPVTEDDSDALTAEELAEDALTAAILAPWTGDLDGMIKRGYVRIGVGDEPVFFFYDGPEPQGITVDIAREFEKHLRATLGKAAATLTVTLAPITRDRMLDALVDGEVDILAANLTITPARSERVDFGDPTLTGVSEIVVTGPAAPPVATLDDLAATRIHARPSSSYFEHLATLNAARTADGRDPIPVVAADGNLDDADLAELVSAGVLPAIVLDDHKARLYAEIYPDLTLHEDIAVHEGGEIAWAIRKDSPQLKQAINGFQDKAAKGTEIGNILFRRWFGDAERVRNAIAPGEDTKFSETFGIIRTHAEAYDFDPILIAAQGYQESGLDQSVRSRAGAIGIMQVLPATAADPNVAIPDIETADRNVEAGVKYLRFLRDRYFSDPEISDLDQALFAFAAYNAGPRNIAKARKRAAAMELDPNRWFGNVEVAAARTISREPVIYVRNILKYYTCYTIYQTAQNAD
ncbi:MAG: lytic transglycosylase F [Rhodobacteraceae bacterium]|nr:lytic transglycosylase F [Paracoccaceae bacterium]